ncbi:hypothetical protein BXZ70DRAFT_913093 [Cristinia sonorae]|uniref:Uncharacterized protein n=1 Tax=Cristinia sonorae TaxID=1940300 RepID=A0A8K0XUS8_9AGAR|nr:hypothetical protein BXZ70DRAFT_913093 [Cristinia sonorae]
MIILDDEQDQVPKLPDPIYYPPVVRSSSRTETSSLPDYETSEAQHKAIPWYKPRRKFWRVLVISLIVYTVLTVAIGVPLIIIKLRRGGSVSYAVPWNPQQASVIYPGQEIVDSPPPYGNAMNCDQWFTVDSMQNSLLTSRATYAMALDTDIFLGSNGSYKVDAQSSSISGALFVGINDDTSVKDIQINVAMSYSTPSIRSRTHICLVDAYAHNGFYIYVPDDLTERERLAFDITMLFPKRQTQEVSTLTVMLPLFDQRYAALSPQLNFDQVVFGGPMSNVTVQSVSASNIYVMSSPGTITGSFGAVEQVVLETMSGEVNANITMDISYTVLQPKININTGNQPLTANVTLRCSDVKPSITSQVLIDANTFNAPLNLDVSQVPNPRQVLPVFVHAGNNLGPTNVYMDRYYEGTFFVQTEYASAVVRDGLPPKRYNKPMSIPSTATQAEPTPVIPDQYGRYYHYDVLQDSVVRGWIGTGNIPKSYTPDGEPGCVQVSSVLSPVLLDLTAS